MIEHGSVGHSEVNPQFNAHYRGRKVSYQGSEWYVHHAFEGRLNLFHPQRIHALLNVRPGALDFVTSERIEPPILSAETPRGNTGRPRKKYGGTKTGVCKVCGGTVHAKNYIVNRTCSPDCAKAAIGRANTRHNK